MRDAPDFPLVSVLVASYNYEPYLGMAIQSVLDSLAPGLIPLGITLLVWWMLRKKVNTVWIIVAIFLVGILGYYTGILGYVG